MHYIFVVQEIGITVNTLRPRKDGRYFADDVLKCIFLNESMWISLKIPPKFVSKGPINNSNTPDGALFLSNNNLRLWHVCDFLVKPSLRKIYDAIWLQTKTADGDQSSEETLMWEAWN